YTLPCCMTLRSDGQVSGIAIQDIPAVNLPSSAPLRLRGDRPQCEQKSFFDLYFFFALSHSGLRRNKRRTNCGREAQNNPPHHWQITEGSGQCRKRPHKYRGGPRP